MADKFERKIIEAISSSLDLPENSVQETICLFENDNSIPFITRYCKDRTGFLDEKQVFEVKQQWIKQKNLQKAKVKANKLVKKLDNISPHLFELIENAKSVSEIEEITDFAKPKKLSLADQAIAKQGVESVARFVWECVIGNHKYSASRLCKHTHELIAQCKESPKAVIQQVSYVVGRYFSLDFSLRQYLFERMMKEGVLHTDIVASSKNASKYSAFAHFEKKLHSLHPSQVSAILRGKKDGSLKIKVVSLKKDGLRLISRHWFKVPPPRLQVGIVGTILQGALDYCWGRLLQPALVRMVWRSLQATATQRSCQVYCRNLEQLLLLPPLPPQPVMALDPGLKHGVKMVVLSSSGALLAPPVLLHILQPRSAAHAQATAAVASALTRHAIRTVAVGDGTGSAQTCEFLSDVIAAHNLPNVQFTRVSEAGASVYSVTEEAGQEFPSLDPNFRSAVSIGRRLLDPLAELAKIPPASLGVGQYQHDVKEEALAVALSDTVSCCVSRVGVNINSASASLLQTVPGVTPAKAQEIVHYRNSLPSKHFSSRLQLKKVKGIGPKAFQQMAGFCVVPQSADRLDRTVIHPDFYPAAHQLLALCHCTVDEMWTPELRKKLGQFTEPQLSRLLSVEPSIVSLIVKSLSHQPRDPRPPIATTSFFSRIASLSVLAVGQQLRGVVANVTDFGVFVYAGLKTQGLIPRSLFPKGTLPEDVVFLGQPLTVRVVAVDAAGQRLTLELGS